MEGKKPANRNNLDWRFHLYHVSWVTGVTALFFIFDWWFALLIIGLLGFYFVWQY